MTPPRREVLGRAFRVPGPVEASDLRDALRRHAAQEAIRALQKCWRSGLARSDLAPQEDPTGPGAPLRLCAADLVGDVTLDSKGALRLPLSASDLGGLLGRDPLDRLWLRAGRPSDSLRRWLRRRADLG